MTITADRLAIISKLRGEYGQRLEILPWWADAIRALDDPAIRMLLLSLVRQSGKSQLLAALAVSELFLVPNAYVMLVTASETQATSVFARKFRRPLDQLRRDLGISTKDIVLTQASIEVPSLGSMLEVIASNAATVPGRSPTLLLFDEARDVQDHVFSALAPSVVGANGKILIASSAGRPRGFFYELLSNPNAEQWVYQSAVNDNPRADGRLLAFLRRTLSLVAPAAAARELNNVFAEDGHSFLPAPLIDAAIDDQLFETPFSRDPAWAFVDLSRKTDLTSVVLVTRGAPRRPEAVDHLVCASITCWDPRLGPTGETDFAEVRAYLAALPQRFPGLTKILVDEGSEAGSVLPFARSHPALSTIIDGFLAGTESNMQLWSALAARLHARTLSIPRHQRLVSELRGLKQEGFNFGSRWRIVDSSKKFHRDVSLALAGAVFAAGAELDLGPIDPAIIAMNKAAPSPTRASMVGFYGSGSSGGVSNLERDAFGGRSSGGAFDLGKRAFGSD
jgi:terminase large subunit-like protein